MIDDEKSMLTCYKSLYDFFEGNRNAVYGVLANIECESAFRANNLQNTFQKKLGMSDQEYTKKVDSGEYRNFVYDRAGYGLCQWTWWGRKHQLLNYAHLKKSSIGSLNMQIDFMKWEMRVSYSDMLNRLRLTDNSYEAAKIFMLEYEKPYDQSSRNIAHRADVARKIEDRIVAYLNITDEHNVVKGDTLWAISRRYGTSILSIVNANKERYPKIRPEYIEAGWTLIIPRK